ncbi:helix-turn-helix domain containing protein [Conexibacter sp. S30A1]|uniref:helix-turn-helix domain containing protein n=1 Tax=Conexibacter sp. S30A1 TaxID=2937800 RepID=UPI00200CD9A8|nr:helix-turn-helix domain containing protein [Conexibacter sp. S30A1]
MARERGDHQRASAGQRGPDPSCEELRAFLADHSQRQAAEHFGVSRQRVQRLLKAGADHRGATEQSVGELVSGWGHDPSTAVKAALLVALARVVDRSSASSTAAAAMAATAAAAELRKALEAVEQAGKADREWLLSVFAPSDTFDMGGGDS